MSRLDDKYKHIIRNAENRKMLKIALTVVSLAVVFVVFAALSRPGITMTSDNADGGTPESTAEAAYSIGEKGAISKIGGAVQAISSGETEHVSWAVYAARMQTAGESANSADSTTDSASDSASSTESGSADWRVLVLSPLSDSDSSSYSCDSEEISTIYNVAKSALGDDASKIAVKCTGGVAQTALYNTASVYDYSECTGVTEIPAGAFCGDTAVARVVLPETVTYISDKAFFGCSSLADISAVKYTAAEEATTAGTYMQVTLPVTGIGAGAFAGCGKLTDDIWNTLDPAKIEAIGESAFAGTQVTLNAEKLTGLADSTDIESARVATATDAVKSDTVADSAEGTTAPEEDSTAGTNTESTEGTAADAAAESTTEASTATRKKTVRRAAANTEATTEADSESAADEGIDAQSGDDNSAEPFTIDATTGAVTMNVEVGSGTYTTSSNGNAVGYLYTDSTGQKVLCIVQSGPTADYTASNVASIYNSLNLGSSTCTAIKFYGSSDTTTTKYYGLKTITSDLKSKASILDFTECDAVSGINGYAFNKDTTLKKILFGENSQLTKITDHVFINSSLSYIKLPDNLAEISNYAFEGCTALTSVTLPVGLTTLNTGAFYNCQKIEIAINDAINLKTIGYRAFEKCLFSEIAIKDTTNLETIGAQAFLLTDWDDTNYTKKIVITGNQALTSIGKDAFCRLKGAEKIIISGNPKLAKLDDFAIHWCENTEEVDLSNNTALTTIGASALISIGRNTSASTKNGGTKINLSGCTSLKSLPTNGILSDGERTGVLGSIDLSNTGITEIPENYFGSGVTGRAAGQYDYLSSVNLSNCTSLTTIGANAFKNDIRLADVNLTGCTALTTIGDSAFYGDTALTDMDLSDCTALTTIGKNAFYGDTALPCPRRLSGSRFRLP